jgi:hypothetical protein
MSKMRVVVILEFDDVEPGSPEDGNIVDTITEDTRMLRHDYDASACWVDDVLFYSTEAEAWA